MNGVIFEILARTPVQNYPQVTTPPPPPPPPHTHTHTHEIPASILYKADVDDGPNNGPLEIYKECLLLDLHLKCFSCSSHEGSIISLQKVKKNIGTLQRQSLQLEVSVIATET